MVDDSIIVRKTLTMILSRETDMEVVGAARSGMEAVAMVKLTPPDVILLDVMMPRMDGVETLTELRTFDMVTPVIMFSSVTLRGAAITVEALSKGANDNVSKPSGGLSTTATIETIRRELVPKIRLHHEERLSVGPTAVVQAVAAPKAPAPALQVRPQIVAIGVSTGGPAALDAILSDLPADFPVPIVIVQHMPAAFTRALAERLDGRSQLRVREAQNGMPLTKGLVILARGDRHMAIRRSGTESLISLDDGPEVNSCKPSVDVMLKSIAEVYGGASLTVILTGMGSDGVTGCERLYELGGKLLVQDAASSVVWGMPGGVFRAGLVQRVVPLDRMVSEIVVAVSH